MRKLIIITILFTSFMIKAQHKLPFYELPIEKEEYTASSTVGRMIDGLGFRYYWSTDGLRAEDLAYQPKGEGKNTQQTITHIYDLTNMMLRLTKTDFKQVKDKSDMSFKVMRKQTLHNIKALSKRIKSSKDLSEFSSEKEGKISIPFFNIINGPIADAIWHTGQVASFRRSSGNPINSKINHFSATVKE